MKADLHSWEFLGIPRNSWFPESWEFISQGLNTTESNSATAEEVLEKTAGHKVMGLIWEAFTTVWVKENGQHAFILDPRLYWVHCWHNFFI